MRIRTTLIFVALAAFGGAFIGYRMFVEKPASAAEREAELSVSAETLYAAFIKDEATAGRFYNDKVVQVSGLVRDMNAGADSTLDVLLETGDPLGAVVCEFHSDEPVPLAKGDTVRIKGFCAGYNLDVLLQRCSIAP